MWPGTCAGLDPSSLWMGAGTDMKTPWIWRSLQRLICQASLKRKGQNCPRLTPLSLFGGQEQGSEESQKFFWGIRKSIHTAYLPCRVMAWRKLHRLFTTCASGSLLLGCPPPPPPTTPSPGILSYTPAVLTKGKKFGDPGWGDRLQEEEYHCWESWLAGTGPAWLWEIQAHHRMLISSLLQLRQQAK